MKCGLLGRTLGHSYSPQIHQKLGSYSYSLFEKEPQELEQFLRQGDFNGLNVTIPYKKEVIAYLDALSPTAKKLGAVNTVLRQPDGKLIGHNTDFFGFQTMLKASGIPAAGKEVLVCGSGGASNTAQAVLREAGAKVVVLSRSGPDNYQNLSKHRDAALIVNTTPLGMYPNVEEAAIEDLDQFPKLEGVLDVIYNPARTRLLLEAEKRGLPAVNGLLMLVAQAKERVPTRQRCRIPGPGIGCPESPEFASDPDALHHHRQHHRQEAPHPGGHPGILRHQHRPVFHHHPPAHAGTGPCCHRRESSLPGSDPGQLLGHVLPDQPPLEPQLTKQIDR